MIADYPEIVVEQDRVAEADFALIQEVVRGIRNVRAEMNVPPARKARVIIQAYPEAVAILAAAKPYLQSLAWAREVITSAITDQKPSQAASFITQGVEVYLPLADLVDMEKEIARIKKEISAMKAEVERSKRMLSNKGFLAKAPAAIVQKERDKEAGYRDKLARLQERLSRLEGAW